MTDKRNFKDLPIVGDIEKIYNIAFAKRRVLKQYTVLAKGLSLWLHKLEDIFFEKNYAIITPAIIADYYSDYNDKWLSALLACLCLHYSSETSITDDVSVFKEILGEHPYQELLCNRGFTVLSLGEEAYRRIGRFSTVTKLVLSRILSSLWDARETNGMELEELFLSYITKGYGTFTALCCILDKSYVKNAQFRINLALVSLYGHKGVSSHREEIENKLNIPEDNGILRFANNIYPNFKKFGVNIEAIPGALGFKKKIDFWYLYNAYLKMVKVQPAECSRYMRRFHKQFKNHTVGSVARYDLKRLEPDLSLL